MKVIGLPAFADTLCNQPAAALSSGIQLARITARGRRLADRAPHGAAQHQQVGVSLVTAGLPSVQRVGEWKVMGLVVLDGRLGPDDCIRSGT